LETRGPARDAHEEVVMHRTSVSLVVALALVHAGCLERALVPSTPCTRSSVSQRIEVTSVDEVDLLFVIDDSGSMEDEQRALRREIPRLVEVLASGDRDGDGREDFRPVRSLHVGVVSTDLGVGAAMPTRLGACRYGTGDDGVLLRGGASCVSIPSPGVLDFAQGSDTQPFVDAVSCVADLGTGGCGLEQQLEAGLKAVTPGEAQDWTRPGYTPPRFLDPATGTFSAPGHALGANAGFLRPDSVLAVVLVTDEEDCSASDSAIFGDDAAAASRFGADVQLRCTRFADPSAGVLHSVQRYVDGLVGLRRNPSLVVFSAIVGVPEDLAVAREDGSFDFGAILADPRMQYAETGERENFLRDACTRIEDGVTVGSADPARRIVTAAAGLSAAGASVSIASICASTFGPAIDGIIAKIADALGGACLPRDLNADPAGRVDCDVLELLPAARPGVDAITECARLPGRELAEVVLEGDGALRELCRVAQLDRADGLANAAPGWFYDDASDELLASCGADGQRIAFTTMSPPVSGSEVRLECLQTFALGRRSTDVACDEDNDASSAPCEIGMFCTPGAEDRCATGTSLPEGGATLACDPVARTCAVPCGDDAACRTAGLLGFVCDPRGVCVNPTCS
jgi:hypothetical protein